MWTSSNGLRHKSVLLCFGGTYCELEIKYVILLYTSKI